MEQLGWRTAVDIFEGGDGERTPLGDVTTTSLVMFQQLLTSGILPLCMMTPQVFPQPMSGLTQIDLALDVYKSGRLKAFHDEGVIPGGEANKSFGDVQEWLQAGAVVRHPHAPNTAPVGNPAFPGATGPALCSLCHEQTHTNMFCRSDPMRRPAPLPSRTDAIASIKEALDSHPWESKSLMEKHKAKMAASPPKLAATPKETKKRKDAPPCDGVAPMSSPKVPRPPPRKRVRVAARVAARGPTEQKHTLTSVFTSKFRKLLTNGDGGLTQKIGETALVQGIGVEVCAGKGGVVSVSVPTSPGSRGSVDGGVEEEDEDLARNALRKRDGVFPRDGYTSMMLHAMTRNARVVRRSSTVILVSSAVSTKPAASTQKRQIAKVKDIAASRTALGFITKMCVAKKRPIRLYDTRNKRWLTTSKDMSFFVEVPKFPSLGKEHTCIGALVDPTLTTHCTTVPTAISSALQTISVT